MKVLLAVDGSANCRVAEEYLSAFPFPQPPDLVLANVCPVADLHVIGPDVPVSVNEIVDQCRREGQNLLEETAPRCRSWAATVKTRLIDGHPGNELVHLADKERADLVVIGARGLNAVQRFFLGSVSEKVVKYAHCSVLVVRGTGQGEVPPLRRILIADDESAASAQAVERFSGLPLGADRHVTLLSVVEQFHGYGMEYSLEVNEYWSDLLNAAQRRLLERAERLSGCGAEVTTLVHQSTSVPDDIIETAREDGTDLLVVGSTGKSRWARMLLGSVSTRVVHHAPCSVWVERPPAD